MSFKSIPHSKPITISFPPKIFPSWQSFSKFYFISVATNKIHSSIIILAGTGFILNSNTNHFSCSPWPSLSLLEPAPTNQLHVQNCTVLNLSLQKEEMFTFHSPLDIPVLNINKSSRSYIYVYNLAYKPLHTYTHAPEPCKAKVCSVLAHMHTCLKHESSILKIAYNVHSTYSLFTAAQ